MSTRILSVGYVQDAKLSDYNLDTRYKVITAKDSRITADPTMLESGVDVGLLRLHIHNAPERRKWLGLLKDRSYEIMVTFSPLHLHAVQPGVPQKDVLKVKYSKFFNIDKDDSAGGFTYKKMFLNLKPKCCLSMGVELTEIDNKKVDPDGLELLLSDTSIGTVLDLAPVNPKDYIMLASNVIGKIQEVFGSDKAGDDPLWNETLALEANPTIPGCYRLCEGFYVIVEGAEQSDFSTMEYHRNGLFKQGTTDEIDTNYLVFSVGKSIAI